MQLAELLGRDQVLLDVRVRNKAQLIAEIARAFARSNPSLGAEAVQAALSAREQLGSTGLGHGFALPHARIAQLDRFRGLFLRLARPLDFQAIDGKPVSLVFALLVPEAGEGVAVKALATVSRAFREPAMREGLLRARSGVQAWSVLTGTEAEMG